MGYLDEDHRLKVSEAQERRHPSLCASLSTSYVRNHKIPSYLKCILGKGVEIEGQSLAI